MINKVILMGRLCAARNSETHKVALLFAVFGLPSIGSTAKTATRKRILSTSSAGDSKRNLSAGIFTRVR